MNRADLLAVYKSYSGIAAVFAPVNGGKPLTRSAISQWEKRVPELRQFQLIKLVPDLPQRIAKAKRNGHVARAA